MKHIFKRIVSMTVFMSVPFVVTYADPVPEAKDPALSQMETIKDIVLDYNIRHNAQISNARNISDELSELSREGKIPSYKEMISRLYVSYGEGHENAFDNPFHVRTKRLDGVSYKSPKRNLTKDVILYSNKFFDEPKDESNPMGFYTVLWEDYSISKVPYDMVVYVLTPNNVLNGAGMRMGFLGEDGLLSNGVSYDEFWSRYRHLIPPIGKKVAMPDNKLTPDNGVESLVMLSRQLSYPNAYGVEREKLWQEFDPAKPAFTLEDIQTGAEHLGLPAQVTQMSLDELQRIGTPAVLLRKTDGRLVTLVALDDDAAVVVSRGITQIVYRSTIEKSYSGQAVVPQKAVKAISALRADNPVRMIQLPSLDEEVSEQVTLHNTGTRPITLQLEYPLLGVTRADLSANTIEPGGTATLDLKMKWRPALDAPWHPLAEVPRQNILVSLQTSDPIMPRLQLAFLLTGPKTATDK